MGRWFAALATLAALARARDDEASPPQALDLEERLENHQQKARGVLGGPARGRAVAYVTGGLRTNDLTLEEVHHFVPTFEDMLFRRSGARSLEALEFLKVAGESTLKHLFQQDKLPHNRKFPEATVKKYLGDRIVAASLALVKEEDVPLESRMDALSIISNAALLYRSRYVDRMPPQLSQAIHAKISSPEALRGYLALVDAVDVQDDPNASDQVRLLLLRALQGAVLSVPSKQTVCADADVMALVVQAIEPEPSSETSRPHKAHLIHSGLNLVGHVNVQADDALCHEHLLHHGVLGPLLRNVELGVEANRESALQTLDFLNRIDIDNAVRPDEPIRPGLTSEQLLHTEGALATLGGVMRRADVSQYARRVAAHILLDLAVIDADAVRAAGGFEAFVAFAATTRAPQLQEQPHPEDLTYLNVAVGGIAVLAHNKEELLPAAAGYVPLAVAALEFTTRLKQPDPRTAKAARELVSETFGATVNLAGLSREAIIEFVRVGGLEVADRVLAMDRRQRFLKKDIVEEFALVRGNATGLMTRVYRIYGMGRGRWIIESLALRLLLCGLAFAVAVVVYRNVRAEPPREDAAPEAPEESKATKRRGAHKKKGPAGRRKLEKKPRPAIDGAGAADEAVPLVEAPPRVKRTSAGRRKARLANAPSAAPEVPAPAPTPASLAETVSDFPPAEALADEAALPATPATPEPRAPSPEPASPEPAPVVEPPAEVETPEERRSPAAEALLARARLRELAKPASPELPEPRPPSPEPVFPEPPADAGAAESKEEEEAPGAESKEEEPPPPTEEPAVDPTVAALLASLGLSALGPRFADHLVDAEALPLLTFDDLAFGMDVPAGAARAVVEAVRASSGKKVVIDRQLDGAVVHQARLEESLRSHRAELAK